MTPSESGLMYMTALETVKNHIVSEPILAHYDLKSEIVLTIDASPVGVGAVLEKRDSDGCTKLTAFASCSLTKAEGNYMQVEREGLAIIFGVQNYNSIFLDADSPCIQTNKH
jgi:hypothetical protein